MTHYTSMHAETTREIDAAAARRFTIYGEQARTNGYGYQAFLLETKVIPKVKASLEEVEREFLTVDNGLSPQVRKMLPDLSNWKRRAVLVGMSQEYEFIYSYTSRLLHATPPSITTDQKNLEVEEFAMFLRYVKIRIIDLLEIANALLAEMTLIGVSNQPNC